MVTPLRAETLRRRVAPELFPFETTADLAPAGRRFGHERAVRALELAVSMSSPGYNAFVVGSPGAGRRSTAQAVLREAAARRPSPPDLVYLFNFEEPDRPFAVSLPAGTGEALRRAMDELIEALTELRQSVAPETDRASRCGNAPVAAKEFDPARKIVAPRMEALRRKFHDQPRLLDYLRAVEDELLAGPDQRIAAGRRAEPFIGDDRARRFRVNLLVSNRETACAPIVFEPNPTYENLIGGVGRRIEGGAVSSDLTLLKAGALHRAAGGYLLLEARELLSNPGAYEAVKRVLREGAIALEEPVEPAALLPTTRLRPEPSPAQVKVVLLGTPWTYELLQHHDEEFTKLFKVKAELSEDMEFGHEATLEYAHLTAKLCAGEGLLPFHRDAVARVVEHGLRTAEHQRRISAHTTEIGDLIREADHWARREGAATVRSPHVLRALDEKVRRSNDLEEYLGRLIEDGTILIDTDGTAVGQANGLSVFDLGDYAFGKPCRVTAKVFLGKEGVINLEREADMGGRIHNKGVLILQGFFGSRYAQRFPIAFAATLCFEQSYGGVEGDSASSAELFALVSALAEIPLRQDVAVTGSVNQMGRIQSVGGINLKVEGFYKTCKLKGLTGSQGVIIPASNVQNLMLDEEVVEAVDRGVFHIYAISDVDEGLEILTGLPAGEANGYGEYPEGTINAKVMRKVERMTRQWKKVHQED